MAFLRLDLGWRQAIALTVALWLFVGIIYLPILIERHPHDGWGSIALDLMTIFVSMLVAMPLYAIFRATQDWPAVKLRLVMAASVAGAAVVQTLFDFQFTQFVASNFQSSWLTMPSGSTRFYGAIFNYVCVFGVKVSLFNLSVGRLRVAEQRRDLAIAQSAAQQAQLAALRFQLNPHFLFNTLNAISAMIVTRRNAEAEQMTERLSGFLRASLASDPTELIPLEEELGLMEDYLDIESVRFGDRMDVRIDCAPEATDLLVPGFLLQPLVENAVKYGVSRSRGTTCVRVIARVTGEQLELTVDDDALPVEAAGDGTSTGTGTGLRNVRRRLDALYGPAGTIEAGPREGGYRVVIRLPARAAD